MPDGPSEEASSAIWWFLHGLIVVVIVLAIVCADRGTRLQFHALLFRLRAWMGRQRAGGGGAYSSVAQPGQSSRRVVKGGGLAAVVPRFGAARPTPGRATRKGGATMKAQRLPSRPSDDEEEADDDFDEPHAPPPRAKSKPKACTRAEEGRRGGARGARAKKPSRPPPLPARERDVSNDMSGDESD